MFTFLLIMTSVPVVMLVLFFFGMMCASIATVIYVVGRTIGRLCLRMRTMGRLYLRTKPVPKPTPALIIRLR